MSEEFPDSSAHGTPGAPTPPLRGDLTVKAIIAGILVAAIMGLSYPYMVLKLGFGPNVSVVAAFFGFLFLRLFDLFGRRGYNRWQNNLTEAAGTSAAQTAFMCVLLGAFDILAYRSKGEFSMKLDPIESFLWLWSAATLGVLLAVPLRRHFVVDEKLPYVDGLSAAETLIVLDPPRGATEEIRKNAMRAFTAVMAGLVLSGLIMLFRDDAKLLPWIPEGWDAPWHYLGHGLEKVLDAAGNVTLDDNGKVVMAMTGVVLANFGVGVSYSLLSIGSGMLVGLRINLSMLIGSVLAWVVMPYFLVSNHVLPETPSRTQVLFWVMWPATGMLVAGGLTSLALRWRLLVDTFRSLRTAKIGSDEFPLSIVVIGVVISAIALCIVQATLLDMPVWMTLAAIVLSLPLMLVGLRVLGETNWGPISALSNMMQGVFAALAPGNITANMVASGTTGTIATSSEMIMQDYKCGEVVGTKPRNLTIMQLIAVPVGAAAVAWMYPALVKAFGITGDHAQLSSPISNKWAGFAELLKAGVSALPTSAMWALLIFSILGVVLTVLEAQPRLKKWVPSPTGIGIGIIVPFSVVFTMFLGGLIGWAWERGDKKSADTYMVPLASGLIAGEALVAVIASIYLAAVA
ncbi:MAG: OPT/YSL family transporter [Deltaproteobacteria bacterium]|nr:OPT/YSL family transporter [Deltaproteobacteria bacterium]